MVGNLVLECPCCVQVPSCLHNVGVVSSVTELFSHTILPIVLLSQLTRSVLYIYKHMALPPPHLHSMPSRVVCFASLWLVVIFFKDHCHFDSKHSSLNGWERRLQLQYLIGSHWRQGMSLAKQKNESDIPGCQIQPEPRVHLRWCSLCSLILRIGSHYLTVLLQGN